MTRPKCVLVGDKIGIETLIRGLFNLNFDIRGIVHSKQVVESDFGLTSDIPFIFVSKDNQVALYNYLVGQHIDLLLVCSFDIILNEAILSIPKLKCINIHMGKIPEYRGSNVLNWALINGEKEIGITIHEMQRLVDRGPVISQWTVPISQEDTALTLRSRALESIEDDLPTLLVAYLAGSILPTEQSHITLKTYKRRTPEDGIFDWSWSNEQIHNLIRALVYPWPGARYIDKFGAERIISNYLSLEEIQELRIRNFSP
jgi:methionyl-tRNA formyltransferase